MTPKDNPLCPDCGKPQAGPAPGIGYWCETCPPKGFAPKDSPLSALAREIRVLVARMRQRGEVFGSGYGCPSAPADPEIMRWADTLEQFAALIESALSQQAEEIERLTHQRDAYYSARNHYDQERREAVQREAGWKGRAELAESEVASLRAELERALLERDSARDQFDRHVEWAAKEAEQAERALEQARQERQSLIDMLADRASFLGAYVFADEIRRLREEGS